MRLYTHRIGHDYCVIQVLLMEIRINRPGITYLAKNLVNSGDALGIPSLKKAALGFFVENLQNETIFIPTLSSGGNANTLPEEESRVIFIEFSYVF